MLRRIASLYSRYATAHFRAEMPGFEMYDNSGRRIGRIDFIKLDGKGLRIAGWTLASQVVLRFGRERAAAVPSLARHDVARSLDIRPEVGFDLTAPRAELPVGHVPYVQLDAAAGGDPVIIALPAPDQMRGQTRLAASFAWACLRSAPAAIRWLMRHDLAARAQVKANLGLELHKLSLSFDETIFGSAFGNEGRPVPQEGEAEIAIVLPVYNAFELLDEVIARVIEHTDLPFRLIVVEDKSPDERVRPWLRERVAAHEAAHPGEAGRIELMENDENLGFIGAVNRGLARAAELNRHVVLLNSDAFVPAGWASRLLAPIVAEPDVASVTPMANDAEIFSAPALCVQTPILPGMADIIDREAQRLSGPLTQAEVPTGMGFCMAMNRAYLAKIPALDTAFGKGYGEEVDWCRKALAEGGRNLALATLYVEHRGGESFGSETKLALVKKNGAMIEKRYPGYDAEVQRWIAADPLISARMALAMAWAGAWSDARAAEGAKDALVPIYLAHTIGGGAENWLLDKIETELAVTGRPAIVLRVGGGRRWMVDVMSPKGTLSTSLDDTDVLMRLLQPIRRREVVYSCGVGDSQAMALPGELLAMAEAADEGRVDILFHDFFPVSPSYTLMGADGRFSGVVPAGQEAEADKAHSYRGLLAKPAGLAEWRAAWGKLVDAADALTCFSEDSAAHVAAAYPQAEGKIRVQPHGLLAEVPQLSAPPAGSPRVIATLGNLGYHKGAKVVSALGGSLTGGERPKLVVIGNIDPAYAPPLEVQVHGDYKLGELQMLVERYGVTEWFIPSIWPETFSYTTHEALATGLPVWSFHLGAQGAAVARAPNGRVIPLTPGKAPEEAALEAFTAV
ncbi:glycosyltransferase [Pseudoroseicyclus sp. H15]